MRPSGRIELYVRSAQGFNFNRRGQIEISGSPFFNNGSLELLTQNPINIADDVTVKVSHKKSSGLGLELYFDNPHSYRVDYIKQTTAR